MKIENLKIFLSVAKTGNIHETAQLFFTSYQNISYIIKNMEKELGIVLFTRDNKGMYLTQEGEAFMEFVEPFINTYNDFLIERNIQNSAMVFHMYTTPVFERYVRAIPDFLYSDHYYLSISKRNVNEMISMISNNYPGIYLVPMYNENRKLLEKYKESIVLAQDYIVTVCHHTNELLNEKINMIDLQRKAKLLTNTYYYPQRTAQIVLNIDDIDVCKNYMREKSFVYKITKFGYLKDFSDSDEWCILLEDRKNIVEYFLVFILPKKQMEVARHFFLSPLQELFKVI